MHCTRQITEDVYYVGASDRRTSLFENLFPIERGVSYNSYLITDEMTCLLDTADSAVSQIFNENVAYVLNGRKLDYLVIHHMEPDHCANIAEILLRHPETIVVGNEKTFSYIRQFYPSLDLEGRTLSVKEGNTLSLGKHTLTFYMAPMVHWPEVMVSYDSYSKTLFSADAFGTFGALDGNLFADEVDYDRDWLDDARRYYSNIVGKYGAPVQTALKKLRTLDIQHVCSLHGPVWRENISYLIEKYDLWSTYTPETKGVMIVYGSMYGNTENAASILASKLSEKGVKNIRVYDASKTDVSYLLSEAFRVSNMVIASPTYNGGIYPKIENFIDDIVRTGLKNKTVSLIQNGTWAPGANRAVHAKLDSLCKFTETEISVKSSVRNEDLAAFEKAADEITDSLLL